VAGRRARLEQHLAESELDRLADLEQGQTSRARKQLDQAVLDG